MTPTPPLEPVPIIEELKVTYESLQRNFQSIRAMYDTYVRTGDVNGANYENGMMDGMSRAMEVVANRMINCSQHEAAPTPAECPDCIEARRVAYSDGTTPGFFRDTCSKHTAPTPAMDVEDCVERISAMLIIALEKDYPQMSVQQRAYICMTLLDPIAQRAIRAHDAALTAKVRGHLKWALEGYAGVCCVDSGEEYDQMEHDAYCPYVAAKLEAGKG